MNMLSGSTASDFVARYTFSAPISGFCTLQDVAVHSMLGVCRLWVYTTGCGAASKQIDVTVDG